MTGPSDPAGESEWRTGSPPGGLPLLGHLLQLRADPLRFLAGLERHGDVVRIGLGPVDAYVVCHPELVNAVLTRPRIFDKGGRLNDVLRTLLGNGLFTSSWADHRRQRRLVQPGFHPQRLASYATLMSDEAQFAAASIRPGEPVAIDALMQSVTARITARALFSADLPAEHLATVQRSIGPINRGVFLRTVDPTGFLGRLPLRRNHEYQRMRAGFNAVVADLIADRRADPGDRGDVLSMLMQARDEDTSESLTDREIHEQVLILMLAGTETTATMLTWALLMVHEHAGARERLEQEVDAVLEGRAPRVDDLPRLDYTRRFITETLRLYSPAWVTSRITTTATDLGGAVLPAAANVLLSSYTVQRSPRVFRQPELFDPDRWLPERARQIGRYAMFPFGVGSRKCIGDSFAMLEATIVLATMVGRWRLHRTSPSLPSPKPLTILATGPVPMLAVERRAGGGPGSNNRPYR